ncbi:hypothetical protein L6164_008001 [Bauhinia variegata]|uniref:Uncharacterized protein n=1 Tax=Bauhinia variegata TaxID=167791 RepID=A0ACB9PKT8_BAUVA|nr:hypothetical protein L6164_008001 [Bauhinia variegata]
MNLNASLSSIAIPSCHRCLHFSKPLISLPSSRCSIISPVRSNKASAIAASMSAGPSPAMEATTAESMEPKKKDPWLIVGLGNPGKEYAGTRHNVGFEMVDAIAEAEEIPMSSVSFTAQFGKGFIGDVPVMLAKPQTFMNSSGESVGPLVSYYKIPLKQVLVIFDDLDLPFAKLRLLPKGGHGGQNGNSEAENVHDRAVLNLPLSYSLVTRKPKVKSWLLLFLGRMRSIINHFKGSVDFPRLRIGIGRPSGKMDPVQFVLSRFTKQEREELNFTFQRGLEAVRILLLEGFNKSATFVNTAKRIEQTS